ncbi:MAG TPA: DUF4268 domain-containing protein [Prolixibacteraceae bacterium]|jgi:hypothetical protein|nr:DUF4268 domain-containing protein [Prolixibacteraceae bacterium]
MYSKDETKILRKEFWIVFARRCEIVPELRFKKKKWVLYDTGLRGIDLKFEVTRKEALVMIEINSHEESRRLQVFETMQKYRLLLEDGFTTPLTWDHCFVRESGQEVCRIYTSLPNVDFHQQMQWPTIFNFFIDNMLILENNLMDIKDGLDAELF